MATIDNSILDQLLDSGVTGGVDDALRARALERKYIVQYKEAKDLVGVDLEGKDIIIEIYLSNWEDSEWISSKGVKTVSYDNGEYELVPVDVLAPLVNDDLSDEEYDALCEDIAQYGFSYRDATIFSFFIKADTDIRLLEKRQ